MGGSHFPWHTRGECSRLSASAGSAKGGGSAPSGWTTVEKVMGNHCESGEIRKVSVVHWRCCNTKFDVDESYMSDVFLFFLGGGGFLKILMIFFGGVSFF